MVRTLPLELSDNIIDCFANEKKALARCSLVCKTWVGCSRRHLWKAIFLNCDDDMSKLDRFIDLLQHSPTLGPLISHLSLSEYYEPDSGKYPRGIIFSLLEFLTALEALTLGSVRLNLAHTAETTLSSTVKALSMTKSVFRGIIHFHHFIHAFPALDDLAVGPDVRWNEWKDIDIVEACDFEVGRLQISVDDNEARVTTWLSRLRSIIVERLSLKAMPFHIVDHVHEWMNAWDACIPQVRSLELDLRYFDGNDDAWSTGPQLVEERESAAVDLSNATSLREITATIHAWWFPENLSVFVHSILSTCPPGIHLVSCTILIIDRYDEDMPDDDEEDDDDSSNEKMGKDWADGFDNKQCPTFDDVRIPSDALTMRLMHPLRWDEHLYRGIRALWSAGIPLRLEHTGMEGSIEVVIPPKGWSVDSGAVD